MFLHIYSAQRFMSQKHRSCFLWSFSQISDHCRRQPDTRQTSRQQNNTTRIPSWSDSINELPCHDSRSSIIWLCLVWWNNSFFFFIYVASWGSPDSNFQWWKNLIIFCVLFTWYEYLAIFPERCCTKKLMKFSFQWETIKGFKWKIR